MRFIKTLRRLSVLGVGLLTVGFSGATAFAGDLNIYRLYNSTTSDHFYTSSDGERITQSCTNPAPRYAKSTIPNILFKAYGAISSDERPVYRAYNPTIVDYLYTTNVDEFFNALNHGYTNEGIPFYAHTSQLSGDFPIYRSYITPAQTHVYSLAGGSSDPERVDEGVVFWANEAGTVPVYDMFNPVDRDQLLATYGEMEKINCTSPKYKYEGIAFSGYSTDNGSRVAVKRYYNTFGGIHAYTTSPVEGQIFTGYNFSDEGVAFWADPGASLDVYRLSQPNGSRVKEYPHYLFTANADEKTAAQNAGYTLEGTPFKADPACTSSCANN